MENKKPEVPATTVEYIDPKRFIDHPLKKELQLALKDRPQKAKDAMDNAWSQIPNQVVPVIFTPIIIDGIEKLALLDGSGRVSKAIENNVPLIAAIRVETEGLDVKEIFKKILAPGHSFHLSLLEVGMAAARLHKEIAIGQGKRTGQKGIDPDDEIAGLLGYGLNSSRVKRARLVYETDPNLLRMVDNRELKSLAAAYNTTKIPRIKNPDSYADGHEMEINVTGVEGTTAGNNVPADNQAKFNAPNGSISESIGREESLVDTLTADEVPEVTVELPLTEKWFELKCPCCNNQIKVLTI